MNAKIAQELKESPIKTVTHKNPKDLWSRGIKNSSNKKRNVKNVKIDLNSFYLAINIDDSDSDLGTNANWNKQNESEVNEHSLFSTCSEPLSYEVIQQRNDLHLNKKEN